VKDGPHYEANLAGFAIGVVLTLAIFWALSGDQRALPGQVEEWCKDQARAGMVFDYGKDQYGNVGDMQDYLDRDLEIDDQFVERCVSDINPAR
jgi:hypothetical protein